MLNIIFPRLSTIVKIISSMNFQVQSRDSMQNIVRYKFFKLMQASFMFGQCWVVFCICRHCWPTNHGPFWYKL